MIRFQKLLHKVKEKISHKKCYRDIEDIYDFVWGIKSHDSVDIGQANLNTTNDIYIKYNKINKTYLLSVESIYEFKTGSKEDQKYILNLFSELTKWMQEQRYKTNIKPNIYRIFTGEYNINSEFKTIEDLYTTFKCLVLGFCHNI